MRYRIVVLGDVQQVGFREYVKKCAQQLQAKGSVKNLDDGSVEIYCAIEESTLEKFKEMIGKPPMGEVEEIKVYPEGSGEYGTPETNFSKFKVIRDEDEVAETLSVMARAGLQMLGKQDKMLEKQDKMIELQNMTIEKIDGVANKIDVLSGKIDAMHQDMNERFDRMEVKYGAISEAIKVFLEEFRTFNAKLDEHNRKLDLILEKLVAMEKK